MRHAAFLSATAWSTAAELGWHRGGYFKGVSQVPLTRLLTATAENVPTALMKNPLCPCSLIGTLSQLAWFDSLRTHDSPSADFVEISASQPRGSVCVSAKDERSIFRLLPPHQQHPNLSFFGRLDRDTTGLMLLGTDGGIGALLTDPGSSITKEYWAGLSGVLPLIAVWAARDRFMLTG
eukprot:6185928-Pleurochrysis_carterae.AAC.3